jgi:calcineurin-like phosphoesterase family protein
MKNIFIIGDLHFGDNDMCTVLDGNDVPLRPFKSVDEHDATLKEKTLRTLVSSMVRRSLLKETMTSMR